MARAFVYHTSKFVKVEDDRLAVDGEQISRTEFLAPPPRRPGHRVGEGLNVPVISRETEQVLSNFQRAGYLFSIGPKNRLVVVDIRYILRPAVRTRCGRRR
jgi:hypothetical protein